MIISRDEYGDGSLFRSQCEMLQNNDPTVTFVDARHGHDGYGLLLGRGLLANTIVENIELNLSSFFSQDEGHANDNRREEVVPMLSYIRSSPTLNKVTLMSQRRHVEFNLTGQLLMAIAESVHVTSLVANVKLPMTEFIHLLTWPNSGSGGGLRHLQVGLGALQGYRDSVTNAASVADAFRVNETLDSLHLRFAAETDDVAGQILSRLGSHNKLSHLIVADEGRPHYENTAILSGLSLFLSTTNVLTDLEIHRINFDLAKMDLLCDGLRRSRTCCMLVMESCTNEATQRWIAFVKSDANREGNVIRDVKMAVRDMEHIRNRTFENAPSSDVIPAILHGSALQRFTISTRLFNTAALLNELAEHVAAITVPCLVLERKCRDMATMEALARFLVATATLQTFQMPANRDCATMLLAALRQNSSLTQVSLLYHANVSIFNTHQQARVNAYCTRNAIVAAADEGDIIDNVSNESTSLEQVPALFAAALPAPRTNANTLLIGLMATTTTD